MKYTVEDMKKFWMDLNFISKDKAKKIFQKMIDDLKKEAIKRNGA